MKIIFNCIVTTFRVFQDDVKLELCVESIFVKGTSINM